MVSFAMSRQAVLACRFSVARIQIRIIIKLKARSVLGNEFKLADNEDRLSVELA